MSTSSTHLREVLAAATASYITVRPDGLVLVDDDLPVQSIVATITTITDARTLYRARQPICRSLDGVRSVSDVRRHCEGCPDRQHCTPQIRVDLLADDQAHRLLLAFTSARNFLAYLARLKQQRLYANQLQTRIAVRNRGRWGELLFSHRAVPQAGWAAANSTER